MQTACSYVRARAKQARLCPPERHRNLPHAAQQHAPAYALDSPQCRLNSTTHPAFLHATAACEQDPQCYLNCCLTLRATSTTHTTGPTVLPHLLPHVVCHLLPHDDLAVKRGGGQQAAKLGVCPAHLQSAECPVHRVAAPGWACSRRRKQAATLLLVTLRAQPGHVLKCGARSIGSIPRELRAGCHCWDLSLGTRVVRPLPNQPSCLTSPRPNTAQLGQVGSSDPQLLRRLRTCHTGPSWPVRSARWVTCGAASKETTQVSKGVWTDSQPTRLAGATKTSTATARQQRHTGESSPKAQHNSAWHGTHLVPGHVKHD